MTQLDSLHTLFVDQLKDLYSAENQIVEALPKMATAASSPDLKLAFQQHLDQTRKHVDRLQRVLNQLGESHNGKKCKGMQGLIEEGNEVIQNKGDSAVKDAALIAAAQRVEHYEIAGYGTVRTYANELGHHDVADLLQMTLDEEGETNKKLTALATGGLLSTGINERAE
jgi:ferritin-like metal-binding protein YciE